MLDYGEGTPIVSYGPFDGCYALFYRVCPKCGKYVKADEKSRLGEYLGSDPNATCKRCGRVQMPFCDWSCDEIEDAYMDHTNIYG